MLQAPLLSSQPMPLHRGRQTPRQSPRGQMVREMARERLEAQILQPLGSPLAVVPALVRYWSQGIIIIDTMHWLLHFKRRAAVLQLQPFCHGFES